jgi:hypothetical protein
MVKTATKTISKTNAIEITANRNDALTDSPKKILINKTNNPKSTKTNTKRFHIGKWGERQIPKKIFAVRMHKFEAIAVLTGGPKPLLLNLSNFAKNQSRRAKRRGSIKIVNAKSRAVPNFVSKKLKAHPAIFIPG